MRRGRMAVLSPGPGVSYPFLGLGGREANIGSTRPPSSPLLPPSLSGPRPSCPHLAGFPVHFHYHTLGRKNRGGLEGQYVEGFSRRQDRIRQPQRCLAWFSPHLVSEVSLSFPGYKPTLHLPTTGHLVLYTHTQPPALVPNPLLSSPSKKPGLLPQGRPSWAWRETGKCE